MSEFLWNINSVVLHGSNRRRLDCVSCRIRPGVTAILGSSGAGKTSLLNLLVGMETPDAGSIERLFDSPAAGLPLYWAPQGGGLWPHLTVRQHLTQVSKEPHLADKLLQEFGLTERQSAFAGELSQGERARISIARALAVPAQVLLFDEPLVHLDGERKAIGWQSIRETTAKSGTHLLLTTHEPETVLREADTVICLADGRLIWEGMVQELYYDPPSATVGRFLGPLNWLDADEQIQWLSQGDRREQSVCIRPEQLHVASVAGTGTRSPESSPLCEVLTSQFTGSYAETSVRRVSDSMTRTFYHRPGGALQIGELAVLRQTNERLMPETFNG